MESIHLAFSCRSSFVFFAVFRTADPWHWGSSSGHLARHDHSLHFSGENLWCGLIYVSAEEAGVRQLLQQSENSLRNGCGSGRRTQPVLGLCMGLECLADRLGLSLDFSWIFLRSFVSV
jgi:hypothetical protein